jgi:hypothetical protein
MTDVPPPPPGHGAPHPTTVVVDTNATVKKSRLPLVLGVVVVVGLVGGFVVWFVAAGTGDDYKPGPAAVAVQAGLKEANITVTFSNAELKCIDTTFAGADLTDLEGAYDPFGGDLGDDITARSGTMLDVCLTDATRLDMIVGSLAGADLGADDTQRRCAAGKFDTIVSDHGGYEEVMVNDIDVSTEALAAFADCGMDLSGG